MDKTVDQSFYLPPDLALMVREFDEGKEIGEPCGIDAMAEIFSWKRGFINCFTGFPNDGKSTFTLFLMLVKAIRDGWKWCIWSPEMISSHLDKGKILYTGSDIYDELIYMKTGKTPYKHVAKKYFIKQLTLEEYMEEIEWVEKYFFVIYPKQREYKDIMASFKFMYDKFKIDGFIVDPFKSFKQEQNGRTDLVLDELFTTTKEFAIQTHSSFNFIAHPAHQKEVKEKDGPNKGRYKIVNQHMLAGGASWDNNMDGIYSIYRPERHLNVNDPKVHFINLKQRKALLVARRGICETIEFDFLRNRYFFNDICPIDGSFSRKKEKEMGTPELKPLHEQKQNVNDPNYMPF